MTRSGERSSAFPPVSAGLLPRSLLFGYPTFCWAVPSLVRYHDLVVLVLLITRQPWIFVKAA